MLYSRWDSVWYTFWTSSSPSCKFKLPLKSLKNKQIFEICSFKPFYINYGDLKKDGINGSIIKIKKYYDSIKGNDYKFTDIEYEELKNYLNDFIIDVDKHFSFKNFFKYEWYYQINKYLE